MNVHERNARLVAQADTPIGHLCRGLLKLLDDAREDSIWCQAIVEYQDELRTLGGIPRGFTATWDNLYGGIVVHPDYQGLV